ncbi:up-regulator of cell proliferation-like [Discoglossus pictus]
MNMEYCRTTKLTRNNVLEIGPECLKEMDDWTSAITICQLNLYKLMALHGSAKNPRVDTEKHRRYVGGDPNPSEAIHPLDVLCVLLHCSDNFFQQEIISKMSMCQFAVPLLLPAGDGPDCTLMLWAIRDIVKKWRPQSLAESKGFKEDSLVHISMPTFSFVKLGKCSVSKSKILNQILSPAQQYHDFFIHRNMEGGNVPRKVSNGLVEISWYFPRGKCNSDVFSDPVAVTNLRGDLESNVKQFHFLAKISSAVFIITESIDKAQYQLIMSNHNPKTNYFFIVFPNDEKPDKDTQEFLKRLQISMDNILVINKTTNKAATVRKIQTVLVRLTQEKSHYHNMESWEQTASSLGIRVDEDSQECQKAKREAKKITDNIHDIEKYKNETMVLQGRLWKEFTNIEKEMCQMKRRGDTNGEVYESSLKNKLADIRGQQYTCNIPIDMVSFILAFSKESHVERCYFIKWIKFYLYLAARTNLPALQSNYKLKCGNSNNNEHLMQNCSLGVEHFVRELGQIYEAEQFMIKERKTVFTQYTKLPEIGANILLDGFPLELIDGDVSNISLQWISNVLTELDNKTGGRCKFRVISVLGVQGTGKSTLLNTMFGLQFPVASGGCTRGAFMSLVKVKDNFQRELGCQFILVIDTEGLKAPEQASLGNRSEHNNELMTLINGLSDITIVNMAMENTTEMKDILQIVVRAFLRMKHTGKKPNCQFVHQNISDVSAHEMNVSNRKKLLEQLDELTKNAASVEKKNYIKSFSDIMEYDPETHHWYIPGLWHGVPPMAPVSLGYSENVYELKKHLIQVMKKSSTKALSIHEFITQVKHLWNTVKHENFGPYANP